MYSGIRNSFPHLSHQLPLPTCSSLPCSYRQPHFVTYFHIVPILDTYITIGLMSAPVMFIQAYLSLKLFPTPCTLVVASVFCHLFSSPTCSCVCFVFGRSPQPAHLGRLHTLLFPFLSHGQPVYESPDGHYFLFCCHQVPSNILPLHSSQAIADGGL